MSEFWRSSPYAADIRREVPPAEFERYIEASRSFDPLRSVAQCLNKSLFFQFGADDELVSAEQRQEFAPYATGLNLLKVYDSATHLQMFFDPAARADRISWLQSKLG
jgi:hypothetical protein